MMTVVDGLGAPAPRGAAEGDVTLDGAVDGADIGVVIQALGTNLYSPVVLDPGICATGTFEVHALNEVLCVEVVATSTLGAELMMGIAQAGPIDPSQIIHPLPNPCGDTIAACLSDPRVIAAAQVVMSRCWPTGTPNTVIGRIYCTPCGDPSGERQGITQPSCGAGRDNTVDILICNESTDPCAVLAHELMHVSQACQFGLLRAGFCHQFWRSWDFPHNRICMELEAYATTSPCGEMGMSGCCEAACRSARDYWQNSERRCADCCRLIAIEECCDGGDLFPNCADSAAGECAQGVQP